MDEEVHTTLAMVHTLSDGDREFSFYRDPGADIMLTEDEIPEKLIAESKIFHFGSLSMTHEGVRRATKKSVALAKKKGALISFDPNLRPPLWKSMEEAKTQIAYGISNCDILKISDNEIQWYTGETDFDNGIRLLKEWHDVPLILLSMGREGSRAYYKDLRIEAAPFLQKNTIETTGAGDTFGACCLNSVLEYGLDNLNEERLKQMLLYANAAASMITTKKGALRVMPAKDEIEDFMINFEKLSR